MRLRLPLLCLSLCLLLTPALHADANEGFEGWIAFFVERSGPAQDPGRETEQRIADVFRRKLKLVAELSVAVQDDARRSINLYVSSPKAEVLELFESAVTEALALDGKLPIHLVNLNSKVSPPKAMAHLKNLGSTFNGNVSYQVVRDEKSVDRRRETERRIADVFHRHFAGKAKLEIKINDDEKNSLSIFVRSAEPEARELFKAATEEAMSLKSKLLVRVISKRISIRKREERKETRAESRKEMKELEKDWREAWEQSMKRMEQKLDRSLRVGLRKALRRFKEAGRELETWDPFEGHEAEETLESVERPLPPSRPTAPSRRTTTRTRRTRRSGSSSRLPLERGAFQLTVNEETGKVVKLVAFDAELGAILTQLATQVPLNFVFGGDGLPRRRVSLSLVDVDVTTAVEALATAARAKTKKHGPLVILGED